MSSGSSGSLFFVNPAQSVVLLCSPSMSKLGEKVAYHDVPMFRTCASRAEAPHCAPAAGREAYEKRLAGFNNLEEVSGWVPKHLCARRGIDQGLPRGVSRLVFAGAASLPMRPCSDTSCVCARARAKLCRGKHTTFACARAHTHTHTHTHERERESERERERAAARCMIACARRRTRIGSILRRRRRAEARAPGISRHQLQIISSLCVRARSLHGVAPGELGTADAGVLGVAGV